MALLLPRLAGMMLCSSSGSVMLQCLEPSLTHICQYGSAPLVKTQRFKPPTNAGRGNPKKQTDGAGTPRQAAVIEMLMHHHHPAVTAEDKARAEDEARTREDNEARTRTEAYLKLARDRTRAWRNATEVRYRLQRDALEALPHDLRVKAMQPDLTPFPPARKFFFDSPPSVYLEPETPAATNTDIGKAGALPKTGKAKTAASTGGKAR